MKNLFLLNRLGFNPDLTTRQSRVDSVSIASRYRVLAILLLCLTLFVGVGNAWGAEAVYKTAKFGSAATTCGNCNQYNSSTAWTSTYNGFTVSVLHGSNNNCAWADVRFGSKTID